MEHTLVRKFLAFFLFLSTAAIGNPAHAGLVIHATEWGVAKFHRYDNKVRPYDSASSWSPYILPDGAAYGGPAITWENPDGSVTLVFSTLDELIGSVIRISDERKERVRVLNIHGHGLPGAMWFPKDSAEHNSRDCTDWVMAAGGADKGNYQQYYSGLSEQDIFQIRSIAENPFFTMGCTVGLRQWQAGIALAPKFKDALTADVQVHFLSCVVGLGSVGENFLKGFAAAAIIGPAGRVEASTNFGLGDWSMHEGMGFWDYQNSSQLKHDNALYVKNKTDREIMQKGTVRVVTRNQATWESSLWSGRDFMSLAFESSVRGIPVSEPAVLESMPVPARVRVPGTSVYVPVRRAQSR